MRFKYKGAVAVICGLLAVSNTQLKAQVASQWGYNAYHIMEAIQNRHPDLVMLAAHRGIHALYGSNKFTGTPENSLESIQNAADNGIEVVELDVRLTQDGVPILSHDSTWGRETDVGWEWNACPSNNGCFNPWGPLPGLTSADGDPGELGGGSDEPTDPQKDVNPNVSLWSAYSVTEEVSRRDSTLKGIRLRNSFNFQLSEWGETPVTLDSALNYIRNKRLNIVVALDIKDANAMTAAWQVVARNNDYNGLPFYNTVFFKFDAAWVLPWPEDFGDTFNTHLITGQAPDSAFMRIMPVYQTSGIAPNLYGSEQSELNSMRFYEQGIPTVVGVEVDLKENPGILTSLYNLGTSGQVPYGHVALANFNPYAEWVDQSRGDNPNDYHNYQYFYSNGYCCAHLTEYLYNGSASGRPSDTQDQRPDWNFILANRNGFNFITTDNVLPMGQYLYNRGQRNGKYFQ